MEKSHSAAYAAAGVDITAGYKGVKLMSADVKRTHIPGVVSDIGGFGGLFAPDLTGITEPVLVSGTDGVGTKLRLAELLNKHDTIGIDCVAMCVNDVICCGAKPPVFPGLHCHRQERAGKGGVYRLRRGRGLCAGGLRPHRR